MAGRLYQQPLVEGGLQLPVQAKGADLQLVGGLGVGRDAPVIGDLRLGREADRLAGKGAVVG
eukprot:1755855-Alexandrium_andersonii.AAC.1